MSVRRPGAVYRVFDIGGTLLYVGSSDSPEARMSHHEHYAPWWPFKCDVRVEWFSDIRDARAAELAAIGTEHPRWNVVGRSPEHPDGPINRAFGKQAAPWLREELELAREWRKHHNAETSARYKRMDIEDRIYEIAASRAPGLRNTA